MRKTCTDVQEKAKARLCLSRLLAPFFLCLFLHVCLLVHFTFRFYKLNNERINAPSMCNQNTKQHVDLINYTKRFMLHYRNRRKFVCMLLGELTHHSSTSYLNSADEDIMEFFREHPEKEG